MKLRGLFALLLLALAACATPVNMRYYTLSGVSSPGATAANARPDYRVAVGPANVPEALDRPQMVLRVAPNRYSIADAEHWSAPLKREIPRVIAEELGRDLPEARVAAQLQYGGEGADYRVLIDVLRFESVPGESITLEAAWSVRKRDGARLHEAHFILVEQVHAPGVAALVAAHETALSALAREIAAALKALVRARR